MFVWGGELVLRTWSHVVPSLGIPRGLTYLALPLSGALMALFALEQVLERLGYSAARPIQNEETA